MTGVETGAVALEVALTLMKRIPSSGLASITDFVAGKEILVLGPPRAGKSSFVQFVQHGILQPETSTPKTYEIDKTATFRISMGRNESLQLRLRRVVDVPGHIGSVAQAKLVAERKPQAVVVMLDVTGPHAGRHPDATRNWVTSFFTRLEELMDRDSSVGKRLTALVVVLNKVDKADPSKFTSALSRLEKLVQRNCRHTQASVEHIPILPGILVANPEHSKLADSILVTLAKSLNG